MSPQERIALRIGTLEALLAGGDCPAAAGMLAGLRLAAQDLANAPAQLRPAAPAQLAAPAPAPESPMERRAREIREAAPPVAARKPAREHWTQRETPEARQIRMAKARASRRNEAYAPTRAEPVAPTPRPALPAPVQADPISSGLDLAHASVEARQARAMEMLKAGTDEHLIAAAARLPLREVYRLAGELREAQRVAA